VHLADLEVLGEPQVELVDVVVAEVVDVADLGQVAMPDSGASSRAFARRRDSG
jgi:hypothetical protein